MTKNEIKAIFQEWRLDMSIWEEGALRLMPEEAKRLNELERLALAGSDVQRSGSWNEAVEEAALIFSDANGEPSNSGRWGQEADLRIVAADIRTLKRHDEVNGG